MRYAVQVPLHTSLVLCNVIQNIICCEILEREVVSQADSRHSNVL